MVGWKRSPLWEHIESHIFREFKRFRPLAKDEENKTDCKALAQVLIDEITVLRQKMNRNREFVRYKTLVGFEGVFSQQWDDDTFGHAEVEAHRKMRAAKYVDSITPQNAARWQNFISRCAATKSNDLATFPIFGEFLRMLGQQKPQFTLELLAADDGNILSFLPAILAGLAASGAARQGRKTAAGCGGAFSENPTGRGRREKLASPRWPQPVAENNSRCKVHRRN